MRRYPFTRKGKLLLIGAVAASLLLLSIVAVFAQGPRPRAPQAAPLGSGFTYQGELKSAGAPVNGKCDLAFRLFDDPSAGNQIGLPITLTAPITGGLFTVMLDAADEFGPNAFNGDGRWLEIAVSTSCPAGGSFTIMTPRQPVTPAPYALSALKTDYKNVLVVAKSGGHFHTIGNALASIADNSATNHYLIWVAPGTYTETITMKPYVDIEGAGELATKVTYSGAGSVNTGTVVGASNAELRWLSVENTGGNGSAYAIAIYNSGTSPRLTHVTAGASGGTSNLGVYNYSSSPAMTNVTASASGGAGSYGVYNITSSSPAMTNVTASASGGTSNLGVYNINSSPAMTSVTASASGGTYGYGVYDDSSSAIIDHSTISASGGTNNYGIQNVASGGSYTVTVNNSRISGSPDSIKNSTYFTTQVGASQLAGAAVTIGGTLTCVFSYSAAYSALNTLCQ